VPKGRVGADALNHIIKLGLISSIPVIVTCNQKMIYQNKLTAKDSIKFHSMHQKDDKYCGNIGAAGVPKDQILNGETEKEKNPLGDGVLIPCDA